MIEHEVGFVIIATAISFLFMFIFGQDLDFKEQLRVLLVFTLFFVALTVGVHLMTGGKNI